MYDLEAQGLLNGLLVWASRENRKTSDGQDRLLSYGGRTRKQTAMTKTSHQKNCAFMVYTLRSLEVMPFPFCSESHFWTFLRTCIPPTPP